MLFLVLQLFISVCVQLLRCVQLFTAPWTVAHQALSMEFSRQEYWSRLPFPIPYLDMNGPLKVRALRIGYPVCFRL